jgi:hypothetical protein
MAEHNEVAEVINEAVTEVNKNGPTDPKTLSLEALVLLLTTERLQKLETDSRSQLNDLRTRQEKVSFLHKMMKTLNTGTDSKGELDLSSYPDLSEMLKKAKDIGVELDEEKLTYSSPERERLLENLRMTVEDLNVQNEMQLQMITRMTNERYESYQMARAILKPLHDDKMNKARSIGGR